MRLLSLWLLSTHYCTAQERLFTAQMARHFTLRTTGRCGQTGQFVIYLIFFTPPQYLLTLFPGQARIYYVICTLLGLFGSPREGEAGDKMIKSRIYS